MDQAVIEALSLAAAVVIGAGGLLHKAGVLKISPASSGKCTDSDCQKKINDHSERLIKGDEILKQLRDSCERTAKAQEEMAKDVNKISRNFAYVRGQLKRFGVDADLDEG